MAFLVPKRCFRNDAAAQVADGSVCPFCNMSAESSFIPSTDARQWRPKALVRFAMGAYFVFLASSAVTWLFRSLGFDEENLFARNFHRLLFHGGLLFLAARFLREQGLSWREGFGIQWGQWPLLASPVILTAIVGWIGANELAKASAFFIEWTGREPETQRMVQLLRESPSIFQLLSIALTALIAAPVVEEILFRGVLYPALSQYWGRTVGILGNSVFFGVIHGNAMSLVSLIFLGALWTLLYQRTRNLLAPIVAHSLFNLSTFVYVLYC